MGITKIKYWEADAIASKIADKAMEHVFAPVEQEIQSHLVACYDAVTASVRGRENEMISIGLLTETEYARFSFAPEDVTRSSVEEALKATGSKLLLRPRNTTWLVPDQELTEEFFALRNKLVPFTRQKSALASELKNQIDGKSAKHVMKTWPEAAEFVASYFNIDVDTGKDVSMTQPLEQLLAKYITPLLAAPQGV